MANNTFFNRFKIIDIAFINKFIDFKRTQIQ